MKKFTKRIMAFLVAIAMIVTIMPMTAKAEGTLEVVDASKVNAEDIKESMPGGEGPNLGSIIKSNQALVDEVSIDKTNKVITVDAQLGNMNFGDGTSAPSAFAIQIQFNDRALVKTGEGCAFDADAVNAYGLKENFGIEDTNTALLWLSGARRVGKVGDTVSIDIIDTNDNLTETYKVVVNDTCKKKPLISGASALVTADINTAIPFGSVIKDNNAHVQVTLDEDNKRIIVKADMKEMTFGTGNNASEGDGNPDSFAIKLKFDNLSLVDAGSGKILEDKDVDPTELSTNFGITEENTALLWIRAASRKNKGTVSTPLTFYNKLDGSGSISETYTLEVEDTSTEYDEDNAPIIENVGILTSGEIGEIPNKTDIAKNQGFVNKVNYNETTKTITVDADLAEMNFDNVSAFAIKVIFNNLENINAGAGEVFEAVDVNPTTLQANYGIATNTQTGLLWIYGDTRVGKGTVTTPLLVKGNNGQNVLYTLVVNEESHTCDFKVVSSGSSATCTASGSSATYKCSKCDKVTGGSSIPATGHKLTAVEAKAATCTEDGVVAHYVCSTCKGTFADAEGKTTIATTVEKAKGHKIEKVEAKKETCSEDGNKEHYKCTGCNELYLDVEGKTVIKEEDIKVAMHEKSKVDEEKATYLKEGTKAHYVCECGKLYSDAEGKTEVTKEDLVIEKLLVGKTSKVAVGTRTRTSLKLAWNKVKDAAGYRVYVSKNGSWVALKTLTGTSYTATGLSAGTKYTFAVRAYVKEEGKVVWANSQKKVYTTKSAYTRPSKTTYISVNSRGTNSIKISWNSVKGATGYRVYVKKKGEKSFKALSTQTGRTYTAKGLKRKTNYRFAVKAYTKDGSTVVWSDVYTQRDTSTR